MLAAGAAAALVALGGGRMAGAADADWVNGNNGSKPFDAVVGGRDSDGQQLYFCRAYHINGFQPGKLNPTHRTCNFGYGGREITSPLYETLVPHWQSPSGGQLPGAPYHAGKDSDGAPLYICRANYQGGLHLGKLREGAGCYIGYGGTAILLKTYQVLTRLTDDGAR